MANQEQLEILRQGVEKWNQWRKDNPSIEIDLSGVDLKDAYLSEVNLSGAYLRDAVLLEAELRGANLGRADLRGVDLRGADLFRANLRGTNLFRANLREADLREADLRGASLIGAVLRGADLRGADLTATAVSQERLRLAINVPSQFLKQETQSGQKLGEELEKVKAELEKAKANEEETSKLNAKIEELESKLHLYETSQTKFIEQLTKASDEIIEPYSYLNTEIQYEKWSYWIFIAVASFSFLGGVLYWAFKGICYSEKIYWVFSDPNFNIYKLFFIVSPLLFFLGLTSTFLGLAFKRRQNIRTLSSQQQEIHHITKVLSAYTLLDDDTSLKNAREFASESLRKYLFKRMNVTEEKDKEEDGEKVDFTRSIQEIKQQILNLKKGD